MHKCVRVCVLLKPLIASVRSLPCPHSSAQVQARVCRRVCSAATSRRANALYSSHFIHLCRNKKPLCSRAGLLARSRPSTGELQREVSAPTRSLFQDATPLDSLLQPLPFIALSFNTTLPCCVSSESPSPAAAALARALRSSGCKTLRFPVSLSLSFSRSLSLSLSLPDVVFDRVAPPRRPTYRIRPRVGCAAGD